MKKTIWKRIVASCSATVTGITLCAFAGCGSGLQADGPVYEYTVIPTEETYMIITSDSTVVPDEGITIDGKFDEDFYEGRNWFYGHKIYNTEDGTLEMTTYFAPNGLVVAAKIRDSRAAIHSSEQIATGNQTCFNGYFAFGTAQSQADGVYEIECTAGNRFKISQFVDGSLIVMNFTSDQMPLHAVVRYGDILEGTCYGYDVEYYIPWEIFEIYDGYRPTSVYFNPTMISADMDEYGNSTNRTWYNFSQQQLGSLFQWGQPNEGYVFDANGFVSNSLTITAEGGGSVTEEWRYDYCITGDTVNFNIVPEEGKQLASITVNGVDRTSSVSDGQLSVICNGDMTVVAQFE